ncbi:PIN domain-containing protein [Agromyces sp. NPDC058126]|uniref:PIN domain-containing protein n=1 Tax=Agromyces sp. NPDC058126 TaxID=3346350 RepID=UPI0036DE2DEC
MSWHFFARGVDGAYARSRLSEEIANLESLRGSLNADVEIAASQFIRWSESAERGLTTAYGNPTATSLVRTERFWRIREIDSRTQRPLQLIHLEIERLLDSFKDLLDELDRARRVVEVDESEALVILDTNVLVHGRPFDEVRWNDALNSKRVKILLPILIIDELDKLKDGRQERARQPLKAIDRLLTSGAASQSVSVRSGVRLQIVTEPRGHQRVARNDDEIVRQAEYLQAVGRNQITILTRDRGMRVRAEIAQLATMMLPANLERTLHRPESSEGE